MAAIERNKKAAGEFEDNLKRQLKACVAKFERISFVDAAIEFVSWLRNVEYRDQKSTAERYVVSTASMIELWVSRTIESLGPGDVEDYKTFRLSVTKVKGVTLRHDLDALSIFNQYARKMKWTKVDWMEEVKKPSGEAIRMHILTEEEEARYFAVVAEVNPDLHDMGRISILQGCRHNSEVLTLKPGDIDLAAMKLYIRKAKRSDRGRILDLTEEAAAILERRMTPGATWIFPSERKVGQHLKKLQGAHDTACGKANVSFVMYDFRHTFATRFAEANPDPYALMAILGHKGLRSVMCYVHVQADQMKEGMRKFEAARNRKRLKAVG